MLHTASKCVAKQSLQLCKVACCSHLQQWTSPYFSSTLLNTNLNRRYMASKKKTVQVSKYVADASKMIQNIDSENALRTKAEVLFNDPNQLSSSIIIQLLKKAGDLHASCLLPIIYNRYYSLVGYVDIVTAEIIDQYCRYYDLQAVSKLYSFLTSNHCSISSFVYEKFLLCLLRSIDNERICLNITKDMLIQHHFISEKAVLKAFTLPAVCDSDMIISILRVANPLEFPISKMIHLLKSRIVSLSKANRHVSVYDVYKYICLLSSTNPSSFYIPYLTKSFEYFIERNISISYNNKDPIVMRALTKALLTVRFNDKQKFSDFVSFIHHNPLFSDVCIDEVFIHFALLHVETVCTYDWQLLQSSSIQLQSDVIEPTANRLIKIGNQAMLQGFMHFLQCSPLKDEYKSTIMKIEHYLEKHPIQKKEYALKQKEELCQLLVDKDIMKLSELTESEIQIVQDAFKTLSLDKQSNIIQSCYYSILTSSTNEGKTVFKHLLKTASLEAIKRYIDDCISPTKIYTTIEAKQFVLTLIYLDRKEEASHVADYLNATYNITSPLVIRELLQNNINTSYL